jgi:hypothetical protein
MSEDLSPLAKAAVAYAATGYPVFPCVSCGKEPRVKGGFLAATTNLRRVAGWWRKWPDANIGIATGGRGYDVLDIDVHDNGHPGNGYASFEKAWHAGLARGWTHLVRTPSGGLHVYYRANPARPQPCWSIPDAHLDFRGTGGYIIAPPSHTCIDGIHGMYTIVAKGTWERPINARAVRDLFRPPPPPRPPVDPARFAADHSEERLAAWVARQVKGNRRKGLVWAACRYAEHGLPEARACNVLGDAARATDLPEKEIRDAISWAYRNARVGGQRPTKRPDRGLTP